MTLPVLATARHRLHEPGPLGHLGGWRASRDGPGRIDAIERRLREAGVAVQSVEPPPLPPQALLARVNDARYLDFLAQTHAQWRLLPDAGPQVQPHAFAAHRLPGSYPQAIEGRAAMHMQDLLAPIGAGTFEAAMAAAGLAVAAADRVVQGVPCAYALCRPPGHHASADMAAGGTYLNNAALAAERLRQRWPRVALLDIDVHHGHGTQQIFLQRDDVFFASLHRDPRDYYPYASGHAGERGLGAGEGFTLNLPLPAHAAGTAYLRQLERAVQALVRFGAQALVVSLGLDAHQADPARGLALQDADFAAIGRELAGLRWPTVLVQEGGYQAAVVGGSALSFVSAWL
ncbi:MAG: histone deacetylase family protein [Aquincola tertiaricarbonis]